MDRATAIHEIYLRLKDDFTQHLTVKDDEGYRPILAMLEEDSVASLFEQIRGYGGRANVVVPRDGDWLIMIVTSASLLNGPSGQDVGSPAPLRRGRRASRGVLPQWMPVSRCSTSRNATGGTRHNQQGGRYTCHTSALPGASQVTWRTR